jgi:hypothetical protein
MIQAPSFTNRCYVRLETLDKGKLIYSDEEKCFMKLAKALNALKKILSKFAQISRKLGRFRAT